MLGGRCKACTIYFDPYSGDGADAGFTLDPALGTPSPAPIKVGGKYFFAKPAIEICNIPHPEGPDANQATQVDVLLHEDSPGSGAHAGLIVGWLNASNFVRVELTGALDPGGCTFLSIFTGLGGSAIADPIPIPLTFEQTHELHACLMPDTYPGGAGDTVRAFVKLADGTYWGVQLKLPGFEGGGQTGLIYSTDASGPAATCTFDNFKYEYFKGTVNHKTCPNCNTPCFIFGDTLIHTPAGDNQLGCYYEVTAGIARWSPTFGNVLEVEAGGTVKLLLPHPQAKTAKIFSIQFYWELNRTIKINTGSGYVIFSGFSRTMTLYNNSGGILGTTTIPAPNDDQYTAEVCYASGQLSALLIGTGIGSGGAILSSPSPDTDDPFVYFGSDAGQVHFKNLEFKKHEDTSEPDDSKCDTCASGTVDCDECDNEAAPEHFAATVTGISNGLCGYCNSANSTYILPFTGGLGGGGVGGTLGCSWEQNLNLQLCGTGDGHNTGPDVKITFADGVLEVKMIILGAVGFVEFVWKKTYITKPKCSEFLRESIPLFSQTGAGAGCISNGGPLLLTAI